jgi:hypothetical protein
MTYGSCGSDPATTRYSTYYSIVTQPKFCLLHNLYTVSEINLRDTRLSRKHEVFCRRGLIASVNSILALTADLFVIEASRYKVFQDL